MKMRLKITITGKNTAHKKIWKKNEIRTSDYFLEKKLILNQ